MLVYEDVAVSHAKISWVTSDDVESSKTEASPCPSNANHCKTVGSSSSSSSKATAIALYLGLPTLPTTRRFEPSTAPRLLPTLTCHGVAPSRLRHFFIRSPELPPIPLPLLASNCRATPTTSPEPPCISTFTDVCRLHSAPTPRPAASLDITTMSPRSSGRC